MNSSFSMKLRVDPCISETTPPAPKPYIFRNSLPLSSSHSACLYLALIFAHRFLALSFWLDKGQRQDHKTRDCWIAKELTTSPPFSSLPLPEETSMPQFLVSQRHSVEFRTEEPRHASPNIFPKKHPRKLAKVGPPA